jgi:hypothetical protein
VARTLKEIEAIVGYTAAEAVSEYKASDYGDREDWNAEKACAAEIDGDAGDQIRRKIKDQDERREAYAMWEGGIVDAWGDE